MQTQRSRQAEEIDRILCELMEQLTGTSPIACEYSLSDRWYKEAKAVFSEGKIQLWNGTTL